jgi:hypothetical protein
VKKDKIATFVRNVLVVWLTVLLKQVSLGKAEFVETRTDLLNNWLILSALNLCIISISSLKALRMAQSHPVISQRDRRLMIENWTTRTFK